MFLCEISIINIILSCRKLESVGLLQQKIKLLSPKHIIFAEPFQVNTVTLERYLTSFTSSLASYI